MPRIYEVDIRATKTKLQLTLIHCARLEGCINTDKISPTTYTDLLNYANTLQDLLEGALEEQAEYEWQQTSGLRPDF